MRGRADREQKTSPVLLGSLHRQGPSKLTLTVRDEEGNVIAAMSRKLDLPLGALELEAKALETGVKFAEEVGLKDVVFEGDS